MLTVNTMTIAKILITMWVTKDKEDLVIKGMVNLMTIAMTVTMTMIYASTVAIVVTSTQGRNKKTGRRCLASPFAVLQYVFLSCG